MKIVIFGASGLIGTKLMDFLSINNDVIGTYLNNPLPKLFKLDATNKKDVRDFLIKYKPDLVIDTIALTSSVACEKNPSLAKKFNYLTAKNILEVCRELNIYFIFISSSYIFDGKKGKYNERDIPNPQGVYGKNKLKAEKYILKFEKSIVLRLDAIYGLNKYNKNNGILGNILLGKEIFLGNPNQIRQPLFINDIAGIILSLIKKKEKGIFHLAGPDSISMLNFVNKLEKLIRLESKIFVLKEKDLIAKPLIASTLNIDKITNLGIKTTSLKEGLKLIKKELK